jgi:DNA-binding NarL/FixJ family response regulator
VRQRVTVPIKKGATPAPDLAEPAPDHDLQPRQQRRPKEDDAVRILVADDHQIVREGIVRILSDKPGLEVVGEAADGRDAVERAVELEPDVVIMDVTMPRLNGIEATREITKRLPSTVVIGLSIHDEDDVGPAICEAGAAAYLQKDSASTGLIRAIRKQVAAPKDSES